MLLAYFVSMTKVYKASNIWSKSSNDEENVDISRFTKLFTSLKQNFEDYKIFTKAEIEKFIMEALSRDYQIMKIIISTDIMFAALVTK